MSHEIVSLRASDYEEATDFLNLVFGARRPRDFEHILPATYRRTDEDMASLYAIRTDGRIRAIVGMYPRRWKVGGAVFEATGIGSVSTHPRNEKSGLMRELMTHCGRLMTERGVQLSFLGGQRQRYQHYGYERCGCDYGFTLNQANLRHSFSDEPGIGFAPLVAADEPTLRHARELHDSRPIRCLRDPERFHDYLLGWHNRPHAALDASGRVVGYLVASEGGERVAEIDADDDATVLRLLRGWTAQAKDRVTVNLQPWRTGLIRALGLWCENVTVSSTGNWKVLDWTGVLQALLGVRRTIGPLEEGSVVISIEGYGSVELSVRGDECRCSRSDLPPSIRVDPLEAMRLLFGPLTPSRVMELPREAAPLEQWCPLPLAWSDQDAV